MHELITVALVLTCLAALVILAACTWAIVETEIEISIRVLPMDEVCDTCHAHKELDEETGIEICQNICHDCAETFWQGYFEACRCANERDRMAEVNPWYFGLVHDGLDSDQLATLVDELDQVRGIALDDLARIHGTNGPMYYHPDMTPHQYETWKAWRDQ